MLENPYKKGIASRVQILLTNSTLSWYEEEAKKQGISLEALMAKILEEHARSRRSD